MMLNKNIIGLLKKKRENKSGRAAVKPAREPIDWFLEALALLGLLVLFGYVIYHFPKLPDIIPSHFNASGQPDDYSAKSTLWLLPGIAVFIYILLSLIVLIPHQFNYSVKITAENALRQYKIAIRLISYLKAAIIWMFFYISYATISVVAKEDSGLGLWFLPTFLGGILIPLIIYFIAAYRNR